MAKKTKTYSYADQAKALIAKYKRASFDPTEKAELDQALSDLAQEQEAYREANGMNQQEQQQMPQFDGGGLMGDSAMYGSGYPEIIPRSYLDSAQGLGVMANQALPQANQLAQMNIAQPTGDNSINFTPEEMSIDAQTNLSPYQTSIIPSLASGAVSTLGNMYLANQAGKGYSKMSAQSVSPQNISLAREREEAKRQAQLASANVTRDIKSGARTRGEYLTNRSAAEAALQRNTSDAVGGSYQREALANAQARQRAEEMNAQYRQQASQYNLGIDNRSRAERDQYISAALQGIPQMGRDILATRQQDAMINSLGEDYGMFMDDKRNIVRKYRR